eukprot:IDg9376t1
MRPQMRKFETFLRTLVEHGLSSFRTETPQRNCKIRVLVAFLCDAVCLTRLRDDDLANQVNAAISSFSDSTHSDHNARNRQWTKGCIVSYRPRLGDEKDITLRGLEAVQSAGKAYLEAYTSILGVSRERLEVRYGCKICVADREFVEEKSEQMLDEAAALPGGVAFLVVGDPFGATTHSDLWMRARERNIRVDVVHNASIMNAVAACGLQLYTFGQAISLCFWTETDRPSSYFDKLLENRRMGLHTLCLLDIKVREPTLESLARGRKVYEPPRYMSIIQAVE